MARAKVQSCRCGHPVAWHDETGCGYGRGAVTGGCSCARVYGPRRQRGSIAQALVGETAKPAADLLGAVEAAIVGLERLRDALTGHVSTAAVVTSSVAVDAKNVPVEPEETKTRRRRRPPASSPADAPVQTSPANGSSVVATSVVSTGGKPMDLGASLLGDGAEQRVFAALVASGGELERDELAFRSVLSPSSSTYRNALSSLRMLNLVEGSYYLRLTDKGKSAPPVAVHLPSRDALLDAWRAKLRGGCEPAVFDVLVSEQPRTLPRETVAERAGYAASSSTYRNALSRLRKKLRLISGRNDLALTTALVNAIWTDGEGEKEKTG